MPRFTKKVTDTTGKSQVVTVETTHPGTCVELLASGYTKQTDQQPPDTVDTFGFAYEEAVRTDMADPVKEISEVSAERPVDTPEDSGEEGTPVAEANINVYPSRTPTPRGPKSKK